MENDQKSDCKSMAGFVILITIVAIFTSYAVLAYTGLV